MWLSSQVCSPSSPSIRSPSWEGSQGSPKAEVQGLQPLFTPETRPLRPPAILKAAVCSLNRGGKEEGQEEKLWACVTETNLYFLGHLPGQRLGMNPQTLVQVCPAVRKQSIPVKPSISQKRQL